MPRIVPIQLLKCLKVLLDDNGGILSAGEVKRLASLMTKYSKKLVSKCIYVQILKCTKTELLGEFMGAGGWSLVYTWLNDAIRAMNWPLVQEILELLLLCPVDVHRLKINSAPKLVKGLCKDGGNEGVRILAKRLVEQWLKVVTENPEATLTPTNIAPQTTAIKTLSIPSVAAEETSANVQQQQSLVNSSRAQISSNVQAKQKEDEQKITINHQSKSMLKKSMGKVYDLEERENEEEDGEDSRETTEQDDQDPLGGVDPAPSVTNYTLTPAQKKASESGLVYKFIIKDGQSILAKVPPRTNQPVVSQTSVDNEEDEAESAEVNEEDTEDNEATEEIVNNAVEADENSSSLDKPEKDDSSSCSEEKTKVEDVKKSEDKKVQEDKEKSDSQKEHKTSKDKERRSSSSSLEKEKEKDKDKENKSSKTSSSSSSSHKSSSTHKSSSSKSSSSTSKSKSSSASSSHRSSSDKHRSDKERSISSKDRDKDKERSSSSSSNNKHRSSSSSKSSGSSSSSSSKDKDKYKDKDKDKSSSSKNKDKQDQSQSDKEKSIQEKVTMPPSSTQEKLSKLTKKSKEELGNVDTDHSNKPTSITIPSKKASMSIEFRKDTERAKTVKTYKSQFRSHGLTEEAPPPPSRKGLKKPSSTTPPGTVLPSSLPSALKRTSPPPRDLTSEKKPKIDINNVTVSNEKPGAIKLIPPKKIQTLVETNLFSDALSAATGTKKVTKRKRPNTPLGKEGPPSPTSPEAPKVMPLKFYQDTLDESKNEECKSDKENDETSTKKSGDENAASYDKDIDDDDDIPLKKVKEDIEQKVAQEKKLESGENTTNHIDLTDDSNNKAESGLSSNSQQLESSPKEEDDVEMAIEKKPGPGCGPNGPPGVLMLHRRKGPKKKLTWHPQESLEQIRYFELDENERCNVTKTSFMDMKNMEHFSERDAIVMARRGFHQEDNMEPQTNWKSLIEVDDVPPHPEGNQSKQRQIQAERELTTLRALYFTHALIPDSPAEAEFEPVFNHDVPLIPLDDLTGNPDAVNDFTSMPWPEPRGSPKQGDNSMSGTGGLGSPVNMFGNTSPVITNVPSNNKQSGGTPFNRFVSPFGGNQGPNGPNGPNVLPMQNSPQNQWQGPPNGLGGPMGGPGPMGGNGPIMGNPFNGSHGSPIMDMGGPGPMGPGPMMNNGPPQNFINQFSPNFGGHPNNPFMGGPPGFGNGPNNFGSMGPSGPMMNGMGPGGPGPMMGNNCPPQMMNGGVHNNRNNNNRGNNGGGNWRGGGSNFHDNGGGNNWRPAGPGLNNRGGGGNGNNGVCKAFMRGHCRLGNSCKYIHPNKSKRI